jgi:lambda repressor-like predicted transcriptional regulator
LPTYRADEFDEGHLEHYGILRKSGRYPWGSGQNTTAGASRRAKTFFEMVKDLEDQGLSRVEIAKGFGMTSTQLRDTTTIARNAIRRENQLKAEKLREKGWSATAIGREMGLNESSVRELLNPQAQERAMILENTVSVLRDEIDKGGWIDVGRGQEYYIPGGGISKEKLRAAVAILKDEGYVQIDVQVDQAGTGAGKKTTYKVMCPSGTTYKDVVTSTDQIRGLTKITDDGGRSWTGDLPPLPISSDRIAVAYKEDGGNKLDGVIYVRPGVKDINIGGSAYAQVRINVDGTHYLKGMAMYKKDLPPGVDLLFNTNKSKNDPKILADGKLGAMKPQSDDEGNPFGANIRRQIKEIGPDGKERLTSVMNILDEEGRWDTWTREFSSQVLSKQSPKLAKQLLDKTYDKTRRQYDEITSLTNPTVRAHLLEKFSDSVDSDAVHLSAAAIPRSSYHVILPFNSLKDTEVYAPNFNQGERVALIRYPHGGTFEIPELTVNNNAPVPKAMIGRAVDAVGINHKVAERLSGADFDGDFVMVIPNDNGAIKSTPALKSLQSFDPQSYKLPEDAPKMTPKMKGKQMGDVSNLITDMTIQKASMDEIARAVKHSMVVIDAEKHHLDYKRSAQDFAIASLKEKYQGGAKRGASTLISRATSEARVPTRRPRRVNEIGPDGTTIKTPGPIDPATGKKMYTPTNETYTVTRTLKDGTVRVTTVPKTTKSTKLAETDDAYSLVSKDGGTLIEKVYADHSNRLKALANLSRKEMVNNTQPIPPASASAKRVYKDEIAQLKADLHVAKMNSPRERAAQVLAAAIIQQKKAENQGMDDATLKKIKSQALAEARTRAGVKKVRVPISDRQWEAIQAGAVSKTMLKEILDNAEIERIKVLATPRPDIKMDSGTSARARGLLAAGLSQAEVARIIGVSLTTLKKGL